LQERFLRSPDAVQRAAFRRDALLIRGPPAWVPALRRTAEEALHRVPDTASVAALAMTWMALNTTPRSRGDCVARMLCSAPRLRRDALLIRGPPAWVPALRRTAEEALRRVRDTGSVAALAMTWLPPEYDSAISRRDAPELCN
jgi:hypothetical protein